MTALDIHSGSLEHRTVSLPGFRVTHSRFPAGLDSVLHAHERAVLAVTLTGRFEHRMGREEADCPAAAAHVKPAGEPHTNRVGTVPARVVSIEPEPDMLDRLGRAGAPFHGRGTIADGRIGRLAWRLATELEGPDPLWRLAAEGIVLEILTLAARSGPSSARPRPPWLGRVLEILHARYAETIRIADLAGEVDVDAREVADRFREHLHVPVGAYVRRLRIDRARELLSHTDDPISAIAARTGFADQSHLTRALRETAGATPAEIRRAARPG